MKKAFLSIIVILIMFSCSTSYNKYDYNEYFQNNEPFVTVESEQEAAYRIAYKLNRIVRHSSGLTVAVLSFTDEYGDQLTRGDIFADMVTSAVSSKRYLRVVERNMLYEIIKEQELSESNLTESRGEVVGKLMNVDAIITGRILRSKWEDQISVRCFKVGTGEVIYASTINIDYRPEEVYMPTSPVYPSNGGTMIIDNSNTNSNNTTIINNNGSNNNNDSDSEVNKKPSVINDGIQNKGKVNLGNKKDNPSSSNQYIIVKPQVEPEPAPVVKKSNTSNKTKIVKPVYINKSKSTVQQKSDPTIFTPAPSKTKVVKKATVKKATVKKTNTTKVITEDPLVEEKGKKTTLNKKK